MPCQQLIEAQQQNALPLSCERDGFFLGHDRFSGTRTAENLQFFELSQSSEQSALLFGQQEKLLFLTCDPFGKPGPVFKDGR